jgi:hypothetical protein
LDASDTPYWTPNGRKISSCDALKVAPNWSNVGLI